MQTIDEIRAELRAYSECQTTDNTEVLIRSNTTLKQLFEISQERKDIRDKIAVLDSPPADHPLFEEETIYEDFFKSILQLSIKTYDSAHLLNLIGEEIEQFE